MGILSRWIKELSSFFFEEICSKIKKKSGRAHVAASPVVAGGTVGEFDVLIQELSSWAMEGVFAEMSKSLVTASLTSPELKRGQEMSGIGVELGTSHLPFAFRVSLQSAIAQVKA